MTTINLLCWEDIPEDCFSQVIVEQELDSENSDDSDDDSRDCTKRPRLKETNKKRFQCPECPKTYMSISGFRGHVLRKHNNPHLKARDHQVDATEDSPRSVDTHTTSQFELQESELQDIIKCAIDCILQHPCLHISDNGVVVQMLGESLLSSTTAIASLADRLNYLVTELRRFLLAAMYERMWGNFHKIVSNGTLVGDIKEILSAVNEDLKDDKRIHSFSVNLLHEVAKCTISEEHKKNAKRAEKTVQAITVQDKAVLYYIAGNLLHCMMKRTQREELLNILRSLCSDSGNIPPEIKAWLKERDRGGLKESTFYFLQLVLSWEAILRKSIDLDCLKTTSLATDRLKEVILTDSVVQQLWHTATGSSGHQILLEALLAQFLTVRGFAVAKLVQKKTDVVLRQENTSRRKSASLRKNLKRL